MLQHSMHASGADRRSEDGLTRSASVMSVMAAAGGDARLSVLGEVFRSPDPLHRQKTVKLKDLGLNVKNLSKLPKVPRPTRILAVFDSAIRGLRDHVKQAEDDYMKAAEESASKPGGVYSLKTKTAERQKKKLEYVLSKVEELLENYTVQNRMREGALHMSKAYEHSGSTTRKASISNLQCGYKECTQTMCAIEAQLESMLGQFHCKMKGVMGFARVMPGDSFEVTLRLGNQKWKSRGRVSKDNLQTWTNEDKAFKVYACHKFTIKVFESKLLGRTMLGEKHCDVLGLFSALPQLLTVDVNSTGTIKLNLHTHWDPLVDFSEQMSFYNPPGRTAQSLRPMSMVLTRDVASRPLGSSLGHSTSADLIDRNARLRHTTAGNIARPDLLPLSECCGKAAASHEVCRSSKLDLWPSSVEEAITSLRCSLESCFGCSFDNCSSTLSSLREIVEEMARLILNVKKRAPSRNSSVSQAIEHAFDFLNLEECDEDGAFERCDLRKDEIRGGDEVPSATDAAVSGNSDCEDSSSSVSPHSTARSITDSGIESYVAAQLSERSTTSSSSSASTVKGGSATAATGSEELDIVFTQHIACCCLVLEELGSAGTLYTREEQLWRHLEHQSEILASLTKLLRSAATDPKSSHNLHRVMSDTAPSAKGVYEFWVRHVKEHPLYMTRDQFATALEKAYTATVRSNFDVLPTKVFKGVVTRILDDDKVFPLHLHPKLVITLQQFLTKMEELDECNLETLVLDAAAELWLLESLKSGDAAVMIRSVQSLQDSIPADEVLNTVLVLLTSPVADVSTSAVNYFKSVERSVRSRDVVVGMVASSLGDPRADVRAGACVALEKLKGHEAYDQLVHISQADVSKRIQAMARSTVSALTNDTHVAQL